MKNKKRYILAICVIVTLGIFSLFLIWLKPTIHLKGSTNIKINVYESYQDPGYVATFFFNDISSKVNVKSNINTSKIGTYETKYMLDYGIYHTVKKRKISVIDNEKPIITLNGDTEVMVCPHKTYVEEGYTAIDNYDKELTNQVKIENHSDQITYTVTDTSNNKTTVTRKIVYTDDTAPVLTLKGNTSITIYLGSAYEEPGYQAIDNCDEDITNKVTVEGNVNTNQVGEYTLTYSVEDSSANMVSQIRTIKVVKKENINGSGKNIYLTFDDGPSRTITPQILQILKEENVKATFFVINRDDSMNYLIKQASDDGHTVALHSYTHDYAYVYSSIDNYFNDLMLIQNKVESITGKKSQIVRFPGGSSNTISKRYSVGIVSSLAQQLSNQGYIYFDWNVDSEDAGRARTKDDVYYNVTNNLYYQNNIVLMHDFENNYKTLNALRDIIHYGKENGYTFKAITNDTVPSRHRINN